MITMKLKKIIATALSAVLALSVFTACGKKETASGPAVKVIDIELTEEEYAEQIAEINAELLDIITGESEVVVDENTN